MRVKKKIFIFKINEQFDSTFYFKEWLYQDNWQSYL